MNSQVSALQDDVKLLKNEIKTVLKELRTAILSRDNPFSTNTGQSLPQADASNANASSDKAKDPDEKLVIPPAPASTPPTPPLSVAPPGMAPGAPPAGMAPVAPPAAAASSGTAEDEPPAHASKSAGRPKLKLIRPDEEEPLEQHWNLLTVASLASWAEEAVETLGLRSFQIVLELACFADLITPKLRDVLDNVARLSPELDDDGLSMNINECLVLLRQLEAIVSGGAVEQAPHWDGRAAQAAHS